MGKVYEKIDDRIEEWMARQHMLFVATAPRADDGLVNLSPKGLDTLRVLDETTLAYLDFGGSGIETIAHLRENGRIVVMMCAFEGPPKILRFYGRGRAVFPGCAGYEDLAARFDLTQVGVRAIVEIALTRIADSCGYGVPVYAFAGHRKTAGEYARKRGEARIRDYLAENNRESIDGLAGLSAEEAARYRGPAS